MLGVELPPEWLRRRLDPREDAFIAHAPLLEALEPNREEPMRDPEIDMTTVGVGEPLDGKRPDLFQIQGGVVHLLALNRTAIKDDLGDRPRRVDHECLEWPRGKAGRLDRLRGRLRATGDLEHRGTGQRLALLGPLGSEGEDSLLGDDGHRLPTMSHHGGNLTSLHYGAKSRGAPPSLRAL